MNDKQNTEQGISTHDKEHLPKDVTNNAVNPDSVKDPLAEELKKTNGTNDVSRAEKDKASSFGKKE